MSTRRCCLLLCAGLVGTLLGCAIGPDPAYRSVPYVARLLPAPEPGQRRHVRPGPVDQEQTTGKRRRDEEAAQAPPRRQVWRDTCLPTTGPLLPTLEPRQPYDYERALDAQEQAYRLRRKVQEMEQEQRELQWEEERVRAREPRFER